MPPKKFPIRICLLLGLLLASMGCQLFPNLGMHRTNRYGVPHQSEPDVSQLEDNEE